MDRLQSIEVFIVVAELGGFAAAARKLAISPAATTRAVANLEHRIGTRLFVRTTRQVRLTESGERFLTDAKRILADLAEAEEAAIGSHNAPRGEIRITAPVLFGQYYITPILADFLDAYPLVTACTMFVDRVVNLIDEGLDMGVRIGPLPDSTLTAVKVGAVRPVVCASPDYLARHGCPNHPNDLANHRIIQSSALTASTDWPFMKNEQPITVRLRPFLTMNTIAPVLDQVAAGRGISRFLSYQAAEGLASGKLTTVLDDFRVEPWPVHIIHQEGRMVSAKIRACVDFFVRHLRGHPALRQFDEH